MNTPLISIILPVYNVAQFLPMCLDSLFSQSVEEGLEIIAVNDGSTDTSLSILEEYRQRYPDILKVWSIENHGVSYARNFGLQKSSGRYIWYVDSDDSICPGACRLLEEKIHGEQNDLIVFGYFKDDQKAGKISESLPLFEKDTFHLKGTPDELCLASPYPWDKIIRRDLALKVRFPEGIRFEDMPVAFYMTAMADSVGVIRECLYQYRFRQGFTGETTRQTLDITRALTYTRKIFRKAGTEKLFHASLEYWAVNKVLIRMSRILRDDNKDIFSLKLRLIFHCFSYLYLHYPNWKKNRLLPLYLPKWLHKDYYFYSSALHMAEAMIRCQYKTPEEYRRFLKIRLRKHPFRGFDSN